MSQPPYPPAGGSDAEDGRPPTQDGPGHAPQPPYQGQAHPWPQPHPGNQPYWGAQPYPGAGYPPASGYGQYEGAPQYGQPYPYGAQYGSPAGPGQPGQQPPPWGQRPATPARSRKAVVSVVAAVAVVVVALAVALVVGQGDDGGGSSGSGIPDATSDPEGLGDDRDLDDFAENCHDGDMEACDELYRYSPRNSAYELFGGTCAGRQPNSDARSVYCVDAFPPAS